MGSWFDVYNVYKYVGLKFYDLIVMYLKLNG